MKSALWVNGEDDLRMIDIPKPTKELVNKSEKIWSEIIYYNGPEQVLSDLFLCKKDDYGHVFNKCFFLNTVYGTRLSRKDLEVISKFISKNELLNKYIADGDCRAVEQLAFNSGTSKKHFSFATKYCSFSNPNQFPIYDNLVESILWEYQKGNHLKKYKRSDLKENHSKENRYPSFKKKIDELITGENLECTYKELDCFLWIMGKMVQAQQKYKDHFKVASPLNFLIQLENTDYLESMGEKFLNDIELIEDAVRNNKPIPIREEILR